MIAGIESAKFEKKREAQSTIWAIFDIRVSAKVRFA
jgi:hypothetical protein